MSAYINHRVCTNGSTTENVPEEEELLAIGQNIDSDESTIDEALAALEDIVFSTEFSELQDEFLERHCHKFEDNEENHLFYTEIFNEYGKLLDEYLSGRIKEKLPSFNLATFASWLLTHEDEIAGDIVELVHSTTDFLHFKSLMLEYKKRHETIKGEKEDEMPKGLSENGEEIDLSQSLSIRSCKIHLK